jgi:hypothetical protein
MLGLVLAASLARAEAPTPAQVMELCGGVDGPAHCGRRIEAVQLKNLPDLATRDGDTLTIRLFPSGTRVFVDSSAAGNDRSYALWDYWSPVNAAILFVTANDEIGYAILQRASGQLTTLPAEPFLAPDRQRLAVADFCSSGCANEVSVWRIGREGVRKELAWRPTAAWEDVTVSWKDAETIAVRFVAPGGSEPRTLERKLTATDWRRP